MIRKDTAVQGVQEFKRFYGSGVQAGSGDSIAVARPFGRIWELWNHKQGAFV